jgi:hypothetical protein
MEITIRKQGLGTESPELNFNLSDIIIPSLSNPRAIVSYGVPTALL